METNGSHIGLVLSGGGARAAYQAGALRAIAEIIAEASPRARPSPFHSISGVSAGAINAAFLGCYADDFQRATADAWKLWAELRSEQILDANPFFLTRLALRWAKDLSFGGLTRHRRSTHLLGTAPLEKLLTSIFDFDALARNLDSGCLRGMAISATHYGNGSSVTFFDGHEGITPWARSSRIGVRRRIRLEHVLASASIPILFKPVPLEGAFYGDGSVRLRAPLSPAIHMGADKVLTIGIRYERPHTEMLEQHASSQMKSVSLVEIAGVMMNGAFMDGLESDIERLRRINRTVSLIPKAAWEGSEVPLREVPILVIKPSEDLGKLAASQFSEFPFLIRHLLKGIGASEQTGSDLLSYLAFDSSYTKKLLELGHADAMGRRYEIAEFFDL
ncbi:MAG: patatin-like phospholipase family protein [Bdellovibrionales bacterium]|nr:patatin-like phospholipase family protein [Bdellovibrionales bacterium]